MYYNGIYHLFYQYNPKGAVWGNIIWGHSVSKDMVNWEALEPPIYPSQRFDKNGAWSGSATILPNNKPIILYIGVDPNNRQVQIYAVPANLSDPYLRRWLKPARLNPVVDPDQVVNASAFRDPSTAWWMNGHSRMVVGSKRNHRGIAYLYRSWDFFHWVKAKHPCIQHPIQACGNALILPGFVIRYDYYTVGTYLTDKDRYLPDNTSADGWAGLRYDYGNFYASKTFFDPAKKRRVLWGWVNESDSTSDDAIPRTVWLDPNQRQLMQWPIQELETLRGKNVDVTFFIPRLDKVEPFNPSLTDAQLLCAKKGSKVQGGVGPFGLLALASKNLEEYTPVFFRIFKTSTKHTVLLCSDARSSSLKDGLYKPSFASFVDIDLADKKLSLRSLIDHSVVESFGAGGKTCITSRVYPTLAVLKNAYLHAFNNGSQTIVVKNLNAWSMKKPLKMN
ncbi:Beta-fructofuranosidase, insoluble isoenzyme CWINV2 [Hibiscus syriacus]|uniref:Beta-fructofuranosidase, insoluble isoenzyme CWINV2 n=1 Tax=Hibiscus syriacus TaxID=106335 RepID=A0A6A2XW98_HIBSY|nr:Beta-fructofuranosidase, insoluble isoenzyme CWINV2 [Hibiscus syriacus]